jgi:hypothetical protein
MNIQSFKPLINLTGLAALVYVMHKIVFHFLVIDDGFYYSLEKLYLLFYTLSTIVFIILKVKEQSFDNVGMSFLSTSVK